MRPNQSWNVGWGYTALCNLNCKHCYNSANRTRDPKELNLEEAYRVVDILNRNNVKSINYGTGEPGTVKDFWKLVKFVHSRTKITQGFTTNGCSVNTTTIGLIKECMNDVDVSIDFPDEKRHNALRGSSSAMKDAINALELLFETDVCRSIVTCLHSKNCDTNTLSGLLGLARKFNANLRINIFRLTGRGKINIDLQPTVRQVNDAFKYLYSNAKIVALPDPYLAAVLGVQTEHSSCPCGHRSFRITPAGTVVPCVYLSGEAESQRLFDLSFAEAMNSDLFLKIRNRKIAFCTDCEHLAGCGGGCANRAYLEYGSMNAPDSLCYKKNGFKHNPFEGIEFELAKNKSLVHEDYLCTAIFEPR